MTHISLSQVILFVSDMASAVQFYRDVLGLTVRYPAELADYSQEMWVELDAGACSLALHGGSQRQPGTEHQMVFFVENLEATHSAIRKAGFEIGEIRLLEDGKPAAKGIDPEGHCFTIRAANTSMI